SLLRPRTLGLRTGNDRGRRLDVAICDSGLHFLESIIAARPLRVLARHCSSHVGMAGEYRRATPFQSAHDRILQSYVFLGNPVMGILALAFWFEDSVIVFRP